jgi:spore maturation protein CgeB
MRILYIGDLSEGSTAAMRLRALRDLGHHVFSVHSEWTAEGLAGLPLRALRKFGYFVDQCGANSAAVDSARLAPPEVLWIDKGLAIQPSTLQRIRSLAPHLIAISYSVDDMCQSHNQSRRYLASIPLYDLHVTTKSFNVAELAALGARRVVFVNNAYCAATHRPLRLTPEERSVLGGPVGFIGGFERERATQMLALAEQGIPVRVWGGGWREWAGRHPNLHVEDRLLWDADYARAINSFDINLCFLRRLNRDVQTQRTVEIPACQAFMLAERTDEHLALLREDSEAAYFSSTAELIDKCRFYLANPLVRTVIASGGRQRCLASDYTYAGQIRHVLSLAVPGSQDVKRSA